MILVAMKNIGGANAILPVASFLKKKYAEPVVLYADGVSYERFKAEYPLISVVCDYKMLLEWYQPRVIIMTTDSPGGVVPLPLLMAAKAREIPVVAVQDFWGNHARHEWPVRPERICVQDDYAKRLVLESWPSYPPEYVWVTGQPAFDRLYEVDGKKARIELRQKFWLTEPWPFVYFSGQAWGMPEALAATINALNLLGQPVYFFLQEHSRVVDPSCETPETADQFRSIRRAYLQEMRNLEYGALVDIQSNDLLIRGADVTVGMYSTSIVKCCYLKKDCISVWVPAARKALEGETKGALSEFPPAALGACFSGINADEIAACFNSVFRGATAGIRNAQCRHYNSDGKAAERIARMVTSSFC